MKKIFALMLAAVLCMSTAAPMHAEDIISEYDTVIFEDDFEGYSGSDVGTSSANRGLIPNGWTVTPTSQSANAFTTVYSVSSAGANLTGASYGNNLLRLFKGNNAVLATEPTAAKEFTMPEAGGLLAVSFDVSTAGALAHNKYVKLLNGEDEGISINYTNDGIMLKNPHGTETDVVIHTEELIKWVSFKITANISDSHLEGFNPGEYDISVNNGTPVRGQLLNGLRSLNTLKFSVGIGSGVNKAMNIDNVSVKKMFAIDMRFENTVSIYNADGNEITDVSELLAGKITFNNMLFNYSREDKKVTVIALLYQDGYLIRTASGENIIPFCLDEGNPVYEYMNFDMELEDSDIIGQPELVVYTWDDMTNMNSMFRTVVSNEQSIINPTVINPDTNILTVSGTTAPFGRVTLQILRDGEDIPSTVIHTDLLKIFYVLRETTADEDGNFEFSVKFFGADAHYTLRINDGIGSITQENVYFENILAKQCIEDMPFAKTLSEVKTITSNFLDAIRFSYALYVQNKGDIQNSESFYKIFYNENLDSPITDVNRMEKIAKVASVMYRLGKASSKAVFAQVMKQYENVLITDDFPAKALYTNAVVVNDMVKDEFYSISASYAQTNAEVLESINKFNEQMSKDLILAVCAKKFGYLSGRAVITELHRVYSTDSAFMTAYNEYVSLSTTQKSIIEESIVGISYNAFSDLKSRFIAIVGVTKEVTGKTNDRSHSGGSSASSAYTINNMAPSTPDYQEYNTKTEKELVFNDIQMVPWAYECIMNLANKNIISGKDEGVFAPDDNVTRGEFIKMLVLALEIISDEAQCNFEDVEKDNWSYPYVASAFEAGIVKGIDNDSFGVGQHVTREDIAVMIARAFNIKGITLTTNETDIFLDEAQISDYAEESVYLLRDAKLLSGYPDGTFAPKSFATRAESAKIVNSILAYAK